MTDSPSFCIVVLNYNGMADTRVCLDSLAPSVRADFQVLLVDNASSEPLDADLQTRWPWLHVERTTSNLGYAGGNNVGLRWASSRGFDWMVLLNNDTTVTSTFAESCRVAAAMAEAQGVAVWGPLIAFMDEPDILMTEGVEFNRVHFPGFFETQRIPRGAAPSLVPTDIVNGCCLAVSRRALEEVGLIDESLFLVHEESDLCLRMAEAGMRCAVLNQLLVWHKGSSAFKRSGRRAQRYYDARNLLWLLVRRPAGRRRGRGLAGSLGVYGRYLWHRYTHEYEQGEHDTARAVLEGVYDGLTRTAGPLVPRRRLGVAAVHRVLGWVARRRSGRGATVAA